MTETGHRGEFVWYELMTTDTDAAQRFYGDVVGWGTQPFDGAPIPYTMWTKGETSVGGLMEVPAEEAPPSWMAHVAVDDVDATAARAEELGATILAGPESVPNVGRWVVLQDPQGAVIAAFRAEQETDAAPGDEPAPGDVSWHELGTTDYESAFEFYSELFGWVKQETMDMGEGGVYQMYGRPGGRMLGGMYDRAEGMPGPDQPAWLYYVRVADLDEAVGKVEEGGGTIVVEPMEVPGGSRIAVGIDPQGAAFGLHEAA